jgi:hypothetical protein
MRLTVIFRDLAWNASVRTVDGLKTSIHDGLRDNVPNIPGATIKPWQGLISILHSTPYVVACDEDRTRLDGGDSRASAQRQGTRLAAASISSIDAMISSKLGAAPKIMEIVWHNLAAGLMAKVPGFADAKSKSGRSRNNRAWRTQSAPNA